MSITTELKKFVYSLEESEILDGLELIKKIREAGFFNHRKELFDLIVDRSVEQDFYPLSEGALAASANTKNKAHRDTGIAESFSLFLWTRRLATRMGIVLTGEDRDYDIAAMYCISDDKPGFLKLVGTNRTHVHRLKKKYGIDEKFFKEAWANEVADLGLPYFCEYSVRAKAFNGELVLGHGSASRSPKGIKVSGLSRDAEDRIWELIKKEIKDKTERAAEGRALMAEMAEMEELKTAAYNNDDSNN